MTHDSTNCAAPTSQGHETVAAVVVTYNRKELLAQCLDALLAQTRPLDAIYVIDNASTDGTAEMIAQEYANCVIHERLPTNTGGAGGFHHGLRHAFEDNYDWIWVMDDDCIPDRDALEKLLPHSTTASVLNSTVVSSANPSRLAFCVPVRTRFGWSRPVRDLTKLRSASKERRIPWALPFNGTLVHRAVVRDCGLPLKDLFIWGDEVEWFLRVRRRYKTWLIVDSVVRHPASADPKQVPAWKYYYRVRNQLYISKRLYPFPTLRVLKNIGLLFLARPAGCSIPLFSSAVRDGMRGKLGRVDDLHR